MQFDVYRNVGVRGGIAPYFVELQHDHLGDVRTTVVAPLLSEEHFIAQGRLTPTIAVLGQNYILSITELFSQLNESVSGRSWRTSMRSGIV